MSLNDTLKCPGLDRTLNVAPKEFSCPQCGHVLEVWTDETKGRCPACSNTFPNPFFIHTLEGISTPLPVEHSDVLIKTAIGLGASEAVMIPSSLIVVDDDLAKLCNGNPVCPNYGLSPSCPPHVPGPSAFRQWQKDSSFCMVIRMDFPPVGVMTQERRDLGRLLHEIVSGVEHKAVELGYTESRSFAGGSCKNMFCYDYDACNVLSENGPCRNPDMARPSMSGFGINVAKLMESAQWQEPPDLKTMSWLAGLVLL